MSGETPGQAAYEAYVGEAHTVPWSQVRDPGAWEVAAQAVWEHWIGRTPKPAPELAAAMAETRRYREALEGVRAIILEGDNSTEGSRLRRSRAVIRTALEGR